MRMSYSVIQDPCLSEEVLQQIDKVVSFCKSHSEEFQMKLTEKYDDNLHYVDKIGRSLLSKFPQDQDEKLWVYIQSALLQGLDLKNFVSSIGNQPGTNTDQVNGRKISEEEEIDDDEETALNEQEIDDDLFCEAHRLDRPSFHKLVDLVKPKLTEQCVRPDAISLPFDV